MAKVNLWSRVGNKLYLLLAEKDFVDNFDNLYDLMADISWKKYFKKSYPIVVQATSIRSELHSTPTIQKI
ncbi:MAG: THUMP domain-containing protein [Patescibacteria group bacterium]|nr:THUMP domain-containing protein [Patescibacteria group bacterium]